MGEDHAAGSLQLSIKRLLDILMSFTCLAILSPLMALIALGIKIGDGGPVFYAQERIGKDGMGFRILKFRSMIVGAEHQGLGMKVVRGDERITPIGRLLRHCSLDEIPQLINVLKGDMSIVGPRPTVRSQVDRYTPRQRRRHEVKPGMAGWAWIHGRNSIPWTERIEHDIWYVDHWSLRLDLLVLLRASVLLLKRQGLYVPPSLPSSWWPSDERTTGGEEIESGRGQPG